MSGYCANCDEFENRELIHVDKIGDVCHNCKWYKFNDIKHEGNNRERLNYNFGINAEAVYASEWEKENKRESWKNNGKGKLELLLDGEVSKRDALVAATVIQWLGTNIGMSFVHECERKIRDLKIDKNIIINDLESKTL